MKLRPENDVLSAFLSHHNLSTSDQVLLKPLGSDGQQLYLNGRAVVAIANIQSLQLQTIAARLLPRKEPSTGQALLLLGLIMGSGFLGTVLKPHLYAYNSLLMYVVILYLIYAFVDLGVAWFKLPPEHHQLYAHTHFGERILLGKAHHQDNLMLIQTWIQQQAKHPILLQAACADT